MDTFTNGADFDREILRLLEAERHATQRHLSKRAELFRNKTLKLLNTHPQFIQTSGPLRGFFGIYRRVGIASLNRRWEADEKIYRLYIHGESYKSIAEKNNTTTGKVKQAFYRAARLKEYRESQKNPVISPEDVQKLRGLIESIRVPHSMDTAYFAIEDSLKDASYGIEGILSKYAPEIRI